MLLNIRKLKCLKYLIEYKYPSDYLLIKLFDIHLLYYNIIKYLIKYLIKNILKFLINLNQKRKVEIIFHSPYYFQNKLMLNVSFLH